MFDSGESVDSSVCHTMYVSHMTHCHTVKMISLSIHQLHDLSVRQQKHDSTWNSVCPSVCLSSVPSIKPSAKFTVKIPMGIPVQNFPKHENLLCIHTSMDWSVNPSGSPSVTLPPSPENPSKIPSNHGEKHAVNYLHEILLILTIHHALCLSLNPSVHCPFCPYICQTMNIRKSWMSSLVLIVGRKTCLKSQQNSLMM